MSEQKHRQIKKWHVSKQLLVDNCFVMPYNEMIFLKTYSWSFKTNDLGKLFLCLVMGNQFFHSKILIVEHLHHLFGHKWGLSKFKNL